MGGSLLGKSTEFGPYLPNILCGHWPEYGNPTHCASAASPFLVFFPSSISGLLVPVFNSASCLPYQWRTGWARGNISILTSILTPLGGVGFRAGLEAKFSCSVTTLSKAKKKNVFTAMKITLPI